MWHGIRTLYQAVRGEQFGEDIQTPHEVISDEAHRGLRRYGTAEQVAASRDSGTAPVLCVPPFAVSARCYDLAPEQSVVEQILAMGRIPYVVDFGDMGYDDRKLGFEDFFDDIVPQALERSVADWAKSEGGEPAPEIDVITWSLGGVVTTLTAAAHPELPIRSITAIGSPFTYSAVSPYPLVKVLAKPTGGMPIPYILRAMGGIPAPLVRIAYRATAFDREIRKPGYIVANSRDPRALARMQVIDRFQDSMPGYPGRLSEQMWENLVLRDEIATGVLDFDGRIVDVSAIDVPVQLFGSHRDAIVSWTSARHGVDLFTSAPRVEFATVDASHLGLIAGTAANEHTWPIVSGFLSGLDRAGTRTA